MKPNYDLLPEHMREGMQLWIEHGIEPGSFLMCVLRNDLMGALGRADEINKERLWDYGNFLYNEVPSTCHGSPEKCDKWAEHNGLAGKQVAQATE